MPPEGCGEGALTVFAEPMITVRSNGVVCAALPTTSSSAVGVVANVSATVCGWSRMLSVSVSPPASVTVSRSSRWDGYSWSGATNEPFATPT